MQKETVLIIKKLIKNQLQKKITFVPTQTRANFPNPKYITPSEGDTPAPPGSATAIEPRCSLLKVRYHEQTEDCHIYI